MKELRKWAGRIWALYGLINFFLLVALFFPFYLVLLSLPLGRYVRPVLFFNQVIFPRIFFTLVGIFLHVEGRHRIRGIHPCLIISNHRSAIDFIANPVAYPGRILFLAKRELTRVPLLGFLVKRLCVLVDRKDPASSARSMTQMKMAFGQGFSVLIYPEGTRNRTGQPLGTFYSGAFRLAKETGLPLAVLTLRNVHHRSAAANALDLWPGLLRMKWSGVLDPSDFNSYQELSDKAREMMYHDIIR